MLGAIIGDIVGSRFEFRNHRSTDFDLFSPHCDFTDDSICTVAVADALVQGRDFGEALHQWCRLYPDPMGSYGGRFARWVASDNPQPYGSLGNGSAMRVSPCGWLPALEKALAAAEGSALPTHDHPEGIKGAQLVAHAIWLLRHGASKADILELAEQHYGYRVSGLSVEQLRRTNLPRHDPSRPLLLHREQGLRGRSATDRLHRGRHGHPLRHRGRPRRSVLRHPRAAPAASPRLPALRDDSSHRPVPSAIPDLLEDACLSRFRGVG